MTSAAPNSLYAGLSPPPLVPTEPEHTETRSIILKWRLNKLGQLFESSKADGVKSKCIKSPTYDDGKWQIYFYANSGMENNMGLYLAALPMPDERHPDGTWQRAGSFRFCFELKGSDGSLYRSMEAQDHVFSSENSNWGWIQFWKRAEAYYNNHRARLQDCFLVTCTIHCAPTPPTQAKPVDQQLIPLALLEAYASLFNDAAYSDVVFRVPITLNGRLRYKRIYASRKILAMRSDYFQALFHGGWAEGQSEDGTAIDDSISLDEEVDEGEDDEVPPSRYQQALDRLMSDDIEPDEDFEVARPAMSESRASTPQVENQPFPDSRDSSATVEGESVADAKLEGEGPEEGKTKSRPMSGFAFSASDDTLPNQAYSTPKSPLSPELNRKPPARAPSRTASVHRRSRITVVDSNYEAYHALLFFLYTDYIAFRPLNSVYYASRLSKPIPASCKSTLREFQHMTAMTAQISGINGKRVVAPCSAKAIYTLADKLGLPDLKARALEHIQKSLSVSTCAFEVFSAFSSRFPEVQASQVEYMLEHWQEVRRSKAMESVFEMVGKGNGSWPSFSSVFLKLLPSLEYRAPILATPSTPLAPPSTNAGVPPPLLGMGTGGSFSALLNQQHQTAAPPSV